MKIKKEEEEEIYESYLKFCRMEQFSGLNTVVVAHEGKLFN